MHCVDIISSSYNMSQSSWLEETSKVLGFCFLFQVIFLFSLKASLKCDLNPVFRRKGDLLWPPLHPSPHFHPPCLGQRMKVLRRLSTSSFGPHLVGCSKSTRSSSLSLPLPPISPHSALSSCLCCCMSHPQPSSASSSWHGYTDGWRPDCQNVEQHLNKC